MAVLISFLHSSVHFNSFSRVYICTFAFARRKTWLEFSVKRRFSSDSSVSSSGIHKYKDLQNLFTRKLRATYHKFPNMPDHSVVCGQQYVYVIEDDGICRMDQTKMDHKMEVLNLEFLCREDEEKSRKQNQRIQWTVQRVRLSPQEKHLAASIKSLLREEFRFVVVKLGEWESNDLDQQNILVTIDGVFSFEWATDDVLFYTTLKGLRSSSVFRLDLLSSEKKITSVYEETQPGVFVEVAMSRDCQIVTINCSTRTSSEVLLSDVTDSHLEPFVVQPRQLGLLYHVEHWKKWLIILANTGPEQEYQVVLTSISEPSMASWVPLFTPDIGTVIKDMDVIGDHCVLLARTPEGELVLIVIPLTHPKEANVIQLPSWVCAVETRKPGLGDKKNVLEFWMSSPIHPLVPCRLYPEKGVLLSGTEDESFRDTQPKSFTTRLKAHSQDGTLVPVTLFHPVPMEDLNRVPLLVHVYGAYGRDLSMEFCPEKKMLLEEGWMLAYCHIRGGGECGLSWHRQGRVEGKMRAVEDLQACLHHLFSAGISSPSLTAVTAYSAGAVPVGALCNRHPNLIQAITLQAPFLDLLGTMEDSSLPLTIEDIDEWGDPGGNPEHKLIISAYCPLHNITSRRYPSMLLTTYSDDSRVPLAGVQKYTERLKKAIHSFFTNKAKSDSEQTPNIILNVQPGGNHHGPEDFEQMLKEEALKLAFLYTELSLDPPRSTLKRRRR